MAKKAEKTKFIMVPNNGTYLCRKQLIKNGNPFYLEELFEIKGIVLNEKPNIKKYDPIVGLKFESYTFKGNYAKPKGEHPVFPDGFPANEKKEIQKVLKDVVFSYDYDKYGWEQIGEDIRLVFGDIEIQEVPVNKLVFYTGATFGVSSRLSKEDFEKYRDNGMPQNIFDDLTGDCDFNGPILSDYASLSVNDNEVDDFYNKLGSLYNQAVVEYNKVHPFASKSKKTPGIKPKKSGKMSDGDSDDLFPYMFVYSAWVKRSFFELEIYEDFDIDRLRVEVSRDELHLCDDPIYTFRLSYEDQDGEIIEFDFLEDQGTNADSAYLYDAQGKSYDFEIVDADDDDDESEEDED